MNNANDLHLLCLLKSLMTRSLVMVKRFGKYLFGRPKSPEIFGFNCSENYRFLWRNFISDSLSNGSLMGLI